MTISVSHIRKAYRRKTVLRDVSFTAGGGTSVGILGENGCGKSTLLSILAGTLKPDGGKFLYEEDPSENNPGSSRTERTGAAENGTENHRKQSEDVSDLLKESSLRVRLTGYVPQTAPLLEELSVKDNLRLWYSGGKTVLRQELEEGVLKQLGISDFLGTQVSRLSGGMKKRVSIGCAVANHPKILLLDEPGAALDLVCKQVILQYLKDFCEKGGTVILASHEIQEIAACTRLFILKEGVLIPFTYDGNADRLAKALINIPAPQVQDV